MKKKEEAPQQGGASSLMVLLCRLSFEWLEDIRVMISDTMNPFVCFAICLLLVSCSNPSKVESKNVIPASEISKKQAPEEHQKYTNYTEKELEAFLDSVGNLPVQALVSSVTITADSVFKNLDRPGRVIPPKDIADLKVAMQQGVISVNNARRIFADTSIGNYCDTANVFSKYSKEKVQLTYFPFDKNFNEYAVCIGDPVHCPNAFLYFLKNNKVLAKQNCQNRYELNLKHYRDIDGKIVVFYVHEFADGSGVWWNNYFFYKYSGDTLLPVLNELENGNLQSPSPFGFRTYWLEATVQKTNPLILKMVYNWFLPDTTRPGFERPFFNDSTSVEYIWNERTKKLEGQYQKSKITRPQILTYYVEDNDLLFMNVYHTTLETQLHDTANKTATLNFLNQMKNYYKSPQGSTND